MPHTFVIEEEIEEHGFCQQMPLRKVGDQYIDCDGRLCIVNSVDFVRYVWEDVALWHITVTAYFSDEFTKNENGEYVLL